MLCYVFSEVHRETSIWALRFKKLWISVACNGVSVTSQQTMSQMVKDVETRAMVLRLALEVKELALAYGVEINHQEIKQLLVNLAKPEYKYTYFSMKYDYDEGKPLEIGSIYENNLLLANQKKMKLYETSRLLQQLKYIVSCVVRVDEILYLKPLRLSDAKALQQLKQNNKVHLSKWLPWIRDKDADEIISAQAFITLLTKQLARKQALHCGIFYQGVLVGMLGFNNINANKKEAEIGYWLDAKHCGKGIATRCVQALMEYGKDQLSIDLFILDTAKNNHKSIAVAKRLGFALNGEAQSNQLRWLC